MEFFKNKYFILFSGLSLLTLVTISLINDIDYEELLELYELNNKMKLLVYDIKIQEEVRETIALTENFKEICDETLKIESKDLINFHEDLKELCMEFIK